VVVPAIVAAGGDKAMPAIWNSSPSPSTTRTPALARRRIQRSGRRFNQHPLEAVSVIRKQTVADRAATKNNLQASVEITGRLRIASRF